MIDQSDLPAKEKCITNYHVEVKGNLKEYLLVEASP